MVTRSGIYLREQGEQVGPFRSRQDAERFLILMGLFGTSREGIEIVEFDANPRPRSTDGAIVDSRPHYFPAALSRRAG